MKNMMYFSVLKHIGKVEDLKTRRIASILSFAESCFVVPFFPKFILLELYTFYAPLDDAASELAAISRLRDIRSLSVSP